MIATLLLSLADDDLVARFRAGHEAAFTEIHRRYRSPLVAFARRMLQGSGHDAEDVVQDAFIRAYRGLRATDRAMALRPWLYMIVRNRALDELRTPQRSDVYDDEARMRAVTDADPAQCYADADEMRQLVAEIARLPERQRLALVMRELGGASHAEMSATLGTSVPATKSLLVRARGTLEEALAA